MLVGPGWESPVPGAIVLDRSTRVGSRFAGVLIASAGGAVRSAGGAICRTWSDEGMSEIIVGPKCAAFAGELRFDGRAPREADVVAMRDRLIHRGPDSDGVYVSPSGGAGLGFRRLRIIDLSRNASQPMTNEDGSIWLVFNGEVYSFKDLRTGLEARGHRFRSQSDSETIIHLYEEKGAEAIDELDGMFGLAIWDERSRRLTIAGDRAGRSRCSATDPIGCSRLPRRSKAFFGHPDIAIEAEPRGGALATSSTATFPVRRRCIGASSRSEPGRVMTIEADGRTTSRKSLADSLPGRWRGAADRSPRRGRWRPQSRDRAPSNGAWSATCRSVRS